MTTRYEGYAQRPVRVHVRTDSCLYERTYTLYDAETSAAHRKALATSKAPGLPIGRRRRSIGQLIARWIDRAWRGHP